MQPNHSTLSLSRKIDSLPGLLYRLRFIIVIIFSVLLLLTGCSKSAGTDPLSQNLYEQFFEQNILNHDYRVKLATDNGIDLTAQYSSYTFRLLKSTTFNGPVTVSSGLANYTGSWSCNDDYSKLTISLPASPAEFIFMTREWKFTKKDLSVMELAPWGTTELKVLHMERM